MHGKLFVVVILMVAWISAGTGYAAPFENLNFEAAVPPGDSLPNWSVNNLGPIYNVACLGSSCVGIHDVDSNLLDPNIPIEGRYSAFLQAGTSGNSGALPLIPASITQTGDVPAGTQSIRLLSTTPAGIDPLISFENLRVSLDGNNIPLLQFSTVGDLVTLAGDVSAFAGLTAELVVSTDTPVQGGPELWAWVDTISFSTEPVPEPATSVLLVALICGQLGARGERRSCRR
jgi:hypothetical protein